MFVSTYEVQLNVKGETCGRLGSSGLNVDVGDGGLG
jgi:hypothetical protein